MLIRRWYGIGILACGDDQGRIWLYNLQTWLESKDKTEAEIFLASRVCVPSVCGDLVISVQYNTTVFDFVFLPKFWRALLTIQRF